MISRDGVPLNLNACHVGFRSTVLGCGTAFYDPCCVLILRLCLSQEMLCFSITEQIQNKEVEDMDRGKNLAEMQV